MRPCSVLCHRATDHGADFLGCQRGKVRECHMRLSSLCPSWGDSRMQAPWGLSVQGRGVTRMLTRDPYLTNDGPRDCSFFQLKVTHIEQSSHVPESPESKGGDAQPDSPVRAFWV